MVHKRNEIHFLFHQVNGKIKIGFIIKYYHQIYIVEKICNS